MFRINYSGNGRAFSELTNRDEKDGGYFFTPSESDVNLLVRIKEFIDDARPNSNAISALNLLQLYHITYQSEYSERAAKLLKVK